MKRGFVTTGRGQIHYRVAGHGRPLILLHPSPFSSKRYLPLLPALGARRRVYALDTPGYGESYTPAQQPTMEDYADAVAEAIVGLGYDKAPLYGDLTGAIIALATAVRHPQRVSALALGVVSYFAGRVDEAERWRRNYPVGFHLGPLRDDGSHFRALFRRIVDAGLHKNAPDQVISPEQVTEWVIERMEMRASALWGFEAVFQCEMDTGLRSLTCPILLASTESHGNEIQIARARAILPDFELREGPTSPQARAGGALLVEEVRDFLAEAIPTFLDKHGV